MSKFLSKLKGEKEQRSDLAPGQTSFSSNNPYNYTQSQPPAYQPPPGPPPGYGTSSAIHPPPEKNDNPPPYHDWTSIPDTALLPPPPPITSEHSSTSNASYDEAAAAHAWCARNHVYTPKIPNVHLIEAVQAGKHDLDRPSGFNGTINKALPTSSPASFGTNAYGTVPSTVFRVTSASANTTTTNPPQQKSSLSRFLKHPAHQLASSTSSSIPADQTLTTLLPVYFAATSNPLSPHFATTKPHPFTIFFEITPLAFHSPNASVAIGYIAKPYPPGRQPGWHRASLAVHSDDGNRYVNDSWGGRSFTQPLRVGERIGLAVQFEPIPVAEGDEKDRRGVLQSEQEVHSPLPKCKTRVYFTRNGAVEGSWEMDEERDAERDEGVAGLQGESDLYAAVGMFGNVDVEIRFFAQGEGFIAPPSI